MEQNQPTVDNDLQKAIDDITNTTNIDPVFSDPVAAPSSVPEGDTGELSEPVGPFPIPEPVAPEPVQEPVPPLEQPVVPMPEMAAPAPAPVQEMAVPEPQPVMPAPEPEPAPLETTTIDTLTVEAPAPSLNTRQIKEAALRDLVPLIDRLTISSSQKFNLYRNIFENMKDYTVLEPAYRSAKEIADDTERAEALLYLIEAIDKM